MRVPILVDEEISSRVILRFSRSSFSFSPKEGNRVSCGYLMTVAILLFEYERTNHNKAYGVIGAVINWRRVFEHLEDLQNL